MQLIFFLFDQQIYSSLFQPLRVSRYQFKKILSCMKLIRSLRYQEVYAQEKVSKIDSLSLVLSGKWVLTFLVLNTVFTYKLYQFIVIQNRLVVSQNQKALHIVFSNQFLDSPEWFGVSTDDFSQVRFLCVQSINILSAKSDVQFFFRFQLLRLKSLAY